MASRAPIRAVVFDLFDTLVDLHLEGIPPLEFRGTRMGGTTPALHAALCDRVSGISFDRFASVLRDVDAEFRTSRYAKGIELPTVERFGAVLARLAVQAPGLVDVLVDVHMSALRGQVRTLDHHPAVLAELRRDSRLALCSNFSHSETALRVLDEAKLREHLDVIVISDMAGIRKPRPEIFQEVLAALGTAPGETLHVGDNIVADVGGAAAVGMRTAWLTRRIADPEERLAAYDGPAPDYRIQHLEELVPLLAAVDSQSAGAK